MNKKFRDALALLQEKDTGSDEETGRAGHSVRAVTRRENRRQPQRAF